MKRIVSLFLILCALAAPALAEVDLSGMTYDELVALKDQINLAMWNSQAWQEVTVPQGIWKVGEDIPEGHWTICAADGALIYVKYGNVLDESGKDVGYSREKISEIISSPSCRTFDPNKDRTEIYIDAKSGFYFVIDSGSAVFTPYAGKPSLGFK